MATFYLYANKSNRVILNKTAPDWKTATPIRTIEAPSWLEARTSVKEYEFERKEGCGYFLNLLNQIG